VNSTVIVALISFVGTLVGTAGGIIASGKLTEYRLEQLEKKVDAHSKASARLPLIEERIGSLSRRVQSLERRHSYDFEHSDYLLPK